MIMREVLFRGQRTDNGQWVKGLLTDLGLAEKEDFAWISGVKVYKNTVGQYTGLTDKNGKRIFEGDIVEYKEEYGQIEYEDGEAMFVVSFDTWFTDFDHLYGTDVEIIGNIHDNPELLKGGAE
jgi:hypothetical protein